MAHYISRHRQYQARRSPQRRGARTISWGWLGWTIGLFMGILGAATVYQAFSKKPEISHVREQVHSQVAPSKKIHVKNQSFEFYSALPNMQVNPKQNAVADIKLEQNKAKDLKQNAKQNDNFHTKNAAFIIQLGTFREQREADNLKARLALRGLTSHIQKSKAEDGARRYRVILGPFASESEALSQKKSLALKKIPGALMLVKSDN